MKFHPSFLLIKYDCSNLKDIYDVHSVHFVHFGHSEYFVYFPMSQEKEEQPPPNFDLQKGLQVYNLGRVTVVVSRSFLEGVCKVS